MSIAPRRMVPHPIRAICQVLPVLLLLAALVGALAAAPAWAQKPKPTVLDPEARADIARVEKYLNEISTLQAKFLQIGQAGETATGTLTIARPGRMRFDYDPPVPQLLIADGTFLIYIDRRLEQTTHVFLRNTPVGVLVAEKVELSGNVTITDFARDRNSIRIRLVKTSEPEEGSITLAFADAPLSLRQWVVVDAQGARTTVTLDDLRYGVPVKPEMFRYDTPLPEPR